MHALERFRRSIECYATTSSGALPNCQRSSRGFLLRGTSIAYQKLLLAFSATGRVGEHVFSGYGMQIFGAVLVPHLPTSGHVDTNPVFVSALAI